MESINTSNDIALQEKYIHRFLIGILIYSISGNFLFEFIPGQIVNVIQIIGLGTWAFYWTKLASLKNISDWYLRLTICLLIIWQLYIICHGFIFKYPFIKDHLSTDNRALAYLVPLAVFVSVNNTHFWQILFNYLHKIGVVFLVLFPFSLLYLLSNQNVAEQYVWVLAMGSGFILLTSFYHSKKRFTVALVVMVLSLLFITVMARRNIMVTCGCFLFFSLLAIPIINKNTSLIKKGIFLFSFVLFTVIGYSIFTSNQDGMFRGFTKRATDNTRETVFLFYFLDMSPTDFVIGKGINGTYFCPDMDQAWSGGSEPPEHRDLDDRIYIECGYLQLILNGGIIYLGLYLLILVPAMFKGFFLSRNLFSKSCAILIFMHLIDMAPFGLPTFSLRQFTLWFCVAVCFSKEIRKMDEDEMRSFLTPEKATKYESDTAD